jgi:hypothetical protein
VVWLYDVERRWTEGITSGLGPRWFIGGFRGSVSCCRANARQELQTKIVDLFDPKFLKMAPGTHNAATNQINRLHCADRTRWWGTQGEFTCARSAISPGLLLCWS